MVTLNHKNWTARLTVLIVDDSLTFRCTLGDRLRREGYDIVLAESGTQAIDALRQAPDAVIVDLEMPGIDGIETCKRIRGAPQGADLPILMLTARDDLPARMRGRAAGANEFLVKIADFETLIGSVKDFVRRSTSGPSSNGPSSNGPSSNGPISSGPISSGPGSAPRSAPPASTGGVLARVAAASGLAAIIAETAIVRACQRAGIDAKVPTQADLQKALPEIQRALSMFLAPEDRAARLDAVAAIIGGGPLRRSGGAG